MVGEMEVLIVLVVETVKDKVVEDILLLILYQQRELHLWTLMEGQQLLDVQKEVVGIRIVMVLVRHLLVNLEILMG